MSKNIKIGLFFEKLNNNTLNLRLGSPKVEKLSLEYLGCILEEHDYEVNLIDNSILEYSIEEIISKINFMQYDIIGFSTTAGNINQTLEIVKKIEKGPLVILGGISSSLHYQMILNENERVNAIVLGEGEFPILDIVQAVGNNISIDNIMNVATKKNFIPKLRNPINLDILPIIKHRYVKKNDIALMSTSRGCRFNCLFCCVTKFYNKYSIFWRSRSVNNICNEIEFLIKKKKIRHIWITDVDFIGTLKERIFEFCNEMHRRNLYIPFEIDSRADDIDYELYNKLKSVGLKAVFIGIESMSNSFLKRFNKETNKETNKNALKILRKLEIIPLLGMILFDEHTTFEELRENINFLKEFGFQYCGNPILQGLKTYHDYNPSFPSNFKDKKVEKIYFDAIEYEKKIDTQINLKMKKIIEKQNPEQILFLLNKLKVTIGDYLYNIINNMT